MEDSLVAEALRVVEVMNETSDKNPWLFRSMEPDEVRGVVAYLEEQSYQLAEAFATVARYDREGVLTSSVCRAFRVIAKQPQPPGPYDTRAPYLRVYPLVLCLYATFIVGVAEQRSDLLRNVLQLHLVGDQQDDIKPIAVALRRLMGANDVFNFALGRTRYFEPVPIRVREVLVPRLEGLLAGSTSRNAFYEAEFVLALAHLKVSLDERATPFPLPGCYSYEREAAGALRAFLARRPSWLGEVLGMPLKPLLSRYDESAREAVNPGAMGFGFVNGALDAYPSKAQST
jgi:hypothetical protein